MKKLYKVCPLCERVEQNGQWTEVTKEEMQAMENDIDYDICMDCYTSTDITKITKAIHRIKESILA